MRKELIIRMSSNGIVIPWKMPEVFLECIFFLIGLMFCDFVSSFFYVVGVYLLCLVVQ